MIVWAVLAGVLMADTEIPTVTLCELARNRAAYCDKIVRLNAVLEFHAEWQCLTDERCPLSHDDQIGFGFAQDAQMESIRQTLDQIAAPEYRYRAEVTLVSVLRNVQMRGFAWYGSLFEADHFESARPAIAVYDGHLEEGRTYRAKATRDAKGEIVIQPYLRSFPPRRTH